MKLDAKNVREAKRAATPITVTISGSLLVKEETMKEGGVKINFEKNQPLTIVPKDSRRRALFRFLFSSPIGESAEIEGLDEKQKNTIRNL